jgi:hypothetical protein
VKWLAALVGVALALSSGTARAGDPDRDYKTVETEHFIVHYYDRPGASLEAAAHRVAVVAEAAHRTLSPALDHEPDRKTIIVLVDDTDSANGFASVLPRNAIQLYATAPGSNTELDDHEDWLYGLTSHEYSHILHLDTMAGLPVIYNSIFGKTWSPNQVMPRWIIEGIAVYEESKRSAGGRNRGTRFDQFIRAGVLAGEDLRIDEVSGSPRRYPRGNAAYIYGSHFLRYIFDRYGDDALRAMSHLSGSFPVPFALNRQIAHAVGKPFTELFDDWKVYLRDRYGMQEMAAERRGLATGRQLTNTHETNHWPHYSADGKELLWLQADGYTDTMVRAMPTNGTQADAHDVVRIDSLGPFDVLADGSLVFEQSRLYRRDYSFQDIMRWDARTHVITRLTTGRRARDPVISPDQRQIAFSMNEQSRSVLAVMDAVPDAPPTIVWQGAQFDQAYQPAWSPDGKRIAFSAWRKGGLRDILIVDVETGAVEEVTRDRAIDMAPEFSADGRYLYFDSDRSTIQNIYAYDTTDHSIWQVTNVLGGAFFAHPSPDGTRVAYEAAVGKGGYDLFEIPADRSAWLPARDYVNDRPLPRDVDDESTVVSAPRPYRAMESLAPQTWTLNYTLGDNKSFTVNTGGTDAFNLHSYQIGIGTQLDNGDVNIGSSYSYNGWRFPFRFALGRTIGDRGGLKIDGVNKTFREETWSGNVSSSVPFESRPGSRWTLSFDYDFDYFRAADTPTIPDDPNMRVPVKPVTDYIQTGTGVRLAFSNVRSVAFGVGPSSGFDASLGMRLDTPALGAKYRNVTASYTMTAYRRLWGATPTLIARATGAYRASDQARTGTYGLGGIPQQDIIDAIVNSTRAGQIGFLRGYPTRSVAGNQFHLINLEYRQELLQIEHGIASLPVYFRRVTGAILSDTGSAWDTEFNFDRNFRTSLGAALRVDAFFGYFVPGTFELGYSHGLTDGGVSQTWLLLTGTL